MEEQDLIVLFRNNPKIGEISKIFKEDDQMRLVLKGLSGSSQAVYAAALFKEIRGLQLFIMPEKEQAAYCYNDLENIFGERDMPFDQRRILFFPASSRKAYSTEKTDNSNVVLRAEVLNKISTIGKDLIIVSYPEAMAEKVVSKKFLKAKTLTLRVDEEIGQDLIIDQLMEYGFERVDFVIGPGQFSLRGGIIDVFSFSSDLPYRISFFGDEIESIRSFKPADQLSVKNLNRISLMPDIQDNIQTEKRESLLQYLPDRTLVWMDEAEFCADRIQKQFGAVRKAYNELNGEVEHLKPEELFDQKENFLSDLKAFRIIETGLKPLFSQKEIRFNTRPQPAFNKNFDFLLKHLRENQQLRIQTLICSANQRQLKRIEQIFEDLREKEMSEEAVPYKSLKIDLHEGFEDDDLKLALFTDHQIFDRYHRFRLRDNFSARESITLKEIYNLQKGDFVTHIDKNSYRTLVV